MKIRELFVTAIRSLWSNKRRSILTMLGIIIGIAAVITILSLGDGLKADTLKNMKADGDGQQSSEIHFSSGQGGGGVSSDGQFTPAPTTDLKTSGFNENDIFLVENNPKVAKVIIRSDNKGILPTQGSINGKEINPIMYLIKSENNNNLIAGRGIKKSELLVDDPVVMINERFAKEGYRNIRNALNSSVELNGINYKIVGIIRNDSVVRKYEQYDVVVPRNVYMTKSSKIPKNTMKITFLKGTDVAKETKKIVEKLNKNGSQHTKGYYDFFDTTEFLKEAQQMIGAVTYFVVAIASISLFIAGIGVMNMMYISVSERTQEIGIRMAVGATQRQVMWQFLIEAIMVTLTGGMIGYLCGIGFAKLASNFLPFKGIVTMTTFLLAFGTSTFIGIVFGILPAKTASNKNLIEILR